MNVHLVIKATQPEPSSMFSHVGAINCVYVMQDTQEDEYPQLVGRMGREGRIEMRQKNTASEWELERSQRSHMRPHGA